MTADTKGDEPIYSVYDCNVRMALQRCHMLLCINHCLLKRQQQKVIEQHSTVQAPGTSRDKEGGRRHVTAVQGRGGWGGCLLIHTEAGKVWITRPGIQRRTIKEEKDNGPTVIGNYIQSALMPLLQLWWSTWISPDSACEEGKDVYLEILLEI